jgi:predicted site-specific integrase-resolvase
MERNTTLRELGTLGELARDAGVCYRTVWRYAKLGRIKTIRLGASVRVPRKEYERILTRGF